MRRKILIGLAIGLPMVAIIYVLLYSLPLDSFWLSIQQSSMQHESLSHIEKWQSVGIFQLLVVMFLLPLSWWEKAKDIYYILCGNSLLVCILAVSSQLAFVIIKWKKRAISPSIFLKKIFYIFLFSSVHTFIFFILYIPSAFSPSPRITT